MVAGCMICLPPITHAQLKPAILPPLSQPPPTPRAAAAAAYQDRWRRAAARSSAARNTRTRCRRGWGPGSAAGARHHCGRCCSGAGREWVLLWRSRHLLGALLGRRRVLEGSMQPAVRHTSLLNCTLTFHSSCSRQSQTTVSGMTSHRYSSQRRLQMADLLPGAVSNCTFAVASSRRRSTRPCSGESCSRFSTATATAAASPASQARA